MAISFTFLDDFVRDYFQYRNLTTTSRLFDHDLLKLPIEQYRSDQIIEQLTLYIHQLEISNLLECWSQIEQHLLVNLNIKSQQLNLIFMKIRMNLYRCYLIHAVQSHKTEKINEFYERLYKVLHQSNEWTKEWFALPSLPNPEENLTFRTYFSKQWNELFWISLQNFLSTAFFHINPPMISTIDEKPSQEYATFDDPPTSTILSKLRAKFLDQQTSTVQQNEEFPSSQIFLPTEELIN